MALDLFLVPCKPRPRSKSSMLKARQALFDALHTAYPDTTLVGDASQGHIANVPVGELHIRPDELHWALHGMEDAAPIHALADWFLEQGFGCEDPQDAGFARPRPKPVATMCSLEDLVGGQWLGFRFNRNYVTALDIDFRLTDGRNALLRLWHFGGSRIPDLLPLVKAVVTDAALQSTGDFETITVRFEGGHELVFFGAVFGGVLIAG